MRKIITFLVSSVDGYYEGPNGEFDWPVVDEEFNEFAVEQLGEVDTLMFGRVTYEMMAQYWPTEQAGGDDPKVAGLMNDTPKIVVSRTLEKADWAGTEVVSDLGEIARRKERPGRDIAVFGSSTLTVELMSAGLLDELRIMVHPVLLGGGRSLLHTATGRSGLALSKIRQFASGNVLLRYLPVPR